MEKDLEGQKGLIDKINQGNKVEKQKLKELKEAYDRYKEKLTDLGVIEQEDGAL